MMCPQARTRLGRGSADQGYEG